MKFQDFQKFKNMIEEALWISYDNDFQIHYKIPPNSCFVKNQFCDELLAWEANINIQPIFNYYKVVAYMRVYLSKSENESFIAMKQAVRDAFEKESSNRKMFSSLFN